MFLKRLTALAAGLLVMAGAGLTFVLDTVLMAEFSDRALVAIPVLVAALSALALGGLRGPIALARDDTPGALRAAAGGALAFWAAPMIVLSQRSTDAPSGSETLFFSTAAWAPLIFVVGYIAAARRVSPIGLAAAMAGTVGAAGILANWERPSSFSAFIKFPTQHTMMIVAGLLFAVGTLAVARVAATHAMPRTAVIGLLGAAAVALPLGLLGGDSVPALQRWWPSLLLLGLATAVFAWSWLSLVGRSGVATASWPFVLVPVAVTSLSALERATGVWGADPIQWPAVLASSALCVAAAATIALSRSEKTAPASTRLDRIALYAAGASAAAAFIAFGLPALSASVRAVAPVTGRFQADWVMYGAETAIGWFALSAGLLVFSAAWGATRGAAPGLVLAAAGSAVVAAAAWPYMMQTPFYTHTRWIPGDIQQVYGTEYARIWTDPVFEPVRLASVVVAALAATLVIAGQIRRRLAGEARIGKVNR